MTLPLDPGCARILWRWSATWEARKWSEARQSWPRCGGCGRPVVAATHPDHDGPAHPDCCTVCAEDIFWLHGTWWGLPAADSLMAHRNTDCKQKLPPTPAVVG